MQRNKQAFFITGTDTDVGKTYIAEALVRYFVQQGKATIGMKPVSAGCTLVNDELLNDDVRALMAASNVHAPLQLKSKADVVIVEGAGGFRVPINREQTMADLAVQLNLPIIMVVGVRLGCINHALMTAGSIRAAGLHLAGWVANRIDPEMSAIEENIATLKAMIKAPCLADVAWGSVPNFSDI
jgi:dethiobiotin synthetase